MFIQQNHIVKPSELPKVIHYAALVFETHSIHHEGDERSKNCPGHGYHEHTETIHSVKYIPFSSQTGMEAWVLAAETQQYNKPVYQIIQSQPVNVKMVAKIEVAPVIR